MRTINGMCEQALELLGVWATADDLRRLQEERPHRRLSRLLRRVDEFTCEEVTEILAKIFKDDEFGLMQYAEDVSHQYVDVDSDDWHPLPCFVCLSGWLDGGWHNQYAMEERERLAKLARDE